MRPVRVLGKQPDVVMPFALLALPVGTSGGKHLAVALLPQLSRSCRRSHLNLSGHIDRVYVRGLLFSEPASMPGGELRVWAAGCVYLTSPLNLNLHSFQISVVG